MNKPRRQHSVLSRLAIFPNRAKLLQHRNLSVLSLLVLLGSSDSLLAAAKSYRIGFLGASSPAAATSRVDAFRQGLRAFGYIEGQNLTIEYRWAEGRLDRLPALASELVNLRVDLIVTAASAATRAAKSATSTIPVVMGFENDPVANGVVASLARPGGNITGVSTLAPEISGKRLELLKETLPRLKRAAVLRTSSEPGTSQAFQETEMAATALGVQLNHHDIVGPERIAAAFQQIVKDRVDGVQILPSPVFNANRKQIVDLTVKHRLAAIFYAPEWVQDGALMAYGPDPRALLQRAAVFVDKILKGTKPSELPVEQPTKFEFLINLNAAKQIGLTIPPNLVARADRVIR